MFQKQATVKQISFNQDNSAAAKSKRKPFLAQAQTKFVNISLLAAALIVGISNTAIAATRLEFDEQTTFFQFIPGGSLARQVGDKLTYNTVLLDPATGDTKATKSGECTTTKQLGNDDFIAFCTETITFLRSGDQIRTEGQINQTALERLKTQKLDITGGTYEGKDAKGKESITQKSLDRPDLAHIELQIN